MFRKAVEILYPLLSLVLFLGSASPAAATCKPLAAFLVSPSSSITGNVFHSTGIADFDDPAASAAKTVSATLDGLPIGSQVCATSALSCTFDFPVTAPDGDHTLVVTTACGGTTASSSFAFTAAGTGDGLTPGLTVVSPTEGQTVAASFPVTVQVAYKDRSLVDNLGSDWGIIEVSTASPSDPYSETSAVPMLAYCSTQVCTKTFTATSFPNGPTTLTVSTSAIIAGNYDPPTATQTVNLNTAPAFDPDWVDILSADHPREDNCAFCPKIPNASTVNVINGKVQFPVPAFDAGTTPLATSLAFYYDSEDIDGSKMQGLALPYRQPLGRGWDHSYNISLFKNQTDGTMVMRGGGLSTHFYAANQDGSYSAGAGDTSALSTAADGSFLVIFRDGSRYSFSSAGALAFIQDRFGNQVTVADHRLDLVPTSTITITDPAQRTTTLHIDQASNLVTMITDPAGSSYALAYTPNTGQIQSITLPASNGQATKPVWQFSYNAQASLSSKTDPNGNTTTYQYDGQGRAVSATSLGTITRGTSYLPGSTTLTGETGGNTTFSYSTDNVITGVVNPVGLATTYSYNADHLLGSESVPVDNQTLYVWNYQYDAYDNRTDVQGHVQHLGTPVVNDPVDYHLGLSYDNANFDQVASITNYLDAPPTTTSFVYDSNGGYRRITSTSPTGGVTVTRLEASGNVHDVNRPDGSVSSYLYDGKGQLASVTTAGLKKLYSDYDALGNPHTVKVYDANGALAKTLLYEFDPVGRVTKETVPAAAPYITAFWYDQNGNRKSVVDANGNKTSFGYDFKGELTSISDALNKNTGMEYVGNGKLTAVVDANGNRTSYEYDLAERLVREVPAAGDPLRYEYDQGGRLWKQRNDRTGAVLVSYSYDGQGRMTRKDFLDGSWASFSFTPGGRLLTAANQDSSYTFSYYPSGLLQTETDGAGRQVGYLYDAAGRRTKLTVLGGTANQHVVDYGYTAEKLTSITSSLAGAFGLSYDALGRRSGLAYPNGVSGTYSYHPDQPAWLTGISYTGTQAVYSVAYPSFDMVGNRTSKNDGAASSFAYDTVYRLLSAAGEGYGYDDVGNRVAGPKAGEGYSYGADNRLLVGPRVSYSYDDYGNLKTSGLWSYTWDLENKLVKAASGPVTVSYKYDALGRRVGKTLEIYKFKRTTDYLYDGQDVADEYVNGALDKQYVRGVGIDEHLALVQGGKSYFYHADGLGSVTRITDSTGKVVQSYSYDSFGQVVGSTGNLDQPYTYTGRELDRETRLYFNRARFYDPILGRFISKDPVGFKGGVNIYTYVQNNPANRRDPRGLYDENDAFEDMGGNSFYHTEYAAFASVLQEAVNCASKMAGKIIPPVVGLITTVITKNPKSGASVYALSDSFFSTINGESFDLPGTPWFFEYSMMNPSSAE